MLKNILLAALTFSLVIGCSDESEPSTPAANTDMGESVDGQAPQAQEDMGQTSLLDIGMTAPLDGGLALDMEIPLEPIAQTEASTQLTSAVCSFAERCELLELLELVTNEPCAQFVRNQFEDGTLASLEAALSTGGVVYDGQKMARCVADLNDAACTSDFDRLFATCDTAFTGQATLGESCTYNQECADDLICKLADACPGQCAPVPSLNEMCTATTGCDDGSICHNGRCSSPISAGATCNEDGVPCAAGLFCKTDLFGSKCQALNTTPVGRGASCDLNGGPFCSAGLSCVAQIMPSIIPDLPSIPVFKCLDKVEANATCYAGAPDQCPAGYFCDGFDLDDIENLDVEGACIALPNEGEPCATSLVGEVCNANLVCSEGLCRPRQRNDGGCATDGECYSGACIDATCTLATPVECR